MIRELLRRYCPHPMRFEVKERTQPTSPQKIKQEHIRCRICGYRRIGYQFLMPGGGLVIKPGEVVNFKIKFKADSESNS